MKRKLLISFGAILFAFIAVTIAGALYLQNYALNKNGNKTGKDLYGTYQKMFKIYPDLRQWTDSLKLCKAVRDTFVYSTDSVRLHAIYVRAQKPTQNTAVIIHGYGNNHVDMLHIGHLYSHDYKYNILLPDLRYAGLSDGTHIQMGWLDRIDVMRWIRVANELFSTDSTETSIVVHGISMGAATTMMVSGEEQPTYVKCFVDDCGYTSVWDEFQGELSNQFHLPAFPLLYVASALTKIRYGWSFGEASALSQVAKCKRPMLFIHGDNDDFVPTSMVYPLYKKKQGAKELWIAPATDHANAYRNHPEEYRKRVHRFLTKYMSKN